MNKIEKLHEQLKTEKEEMKAREMEIQEEIHKETIKREEKMKKIAEKKETEYNNELTRQERRLHYYQKIEGQDNYKAKLQTFSQDVNSMFQGSGSSRYLVIKLFAIVDFLKEEIEELESRVKMLEAR